MFLEKICIKKFRNIDEANLELNQKTNVIIGENAAGKTSFLEAIDVLSRGRSFRTNKIENLIKDGENQLYVGAYEGTNKKKLEIEKAKKKTKILINNKEEAKQSRLAEELAIQSIHPNSHGLVEGAPSERRSFMDWGLFHVEQNFKNEWSAYTRLLKQRNEALKIKDSEESVWKEKLAPIGENITKLRQNYIDDLKEHLIYTQQEIMPDVELEFYYDKGWPGKNSFIEALNERVKLDTEKGYTGCGPQNADLKIVLNKKDAQKVCSRGQQKLIANIMLLSQSKDFLIKKKYPSIILVDDLSAELTLEMQEKVLERLFETKSQIFLTALNDSVLAEVLSEMDANVFHVEHGEIMQ
jgi:DNA replication and repair protein RecF